MSSSSRDPDSALWQAYVKGVTPLRGSKVSDTCASPWRFTANPVQAASTLDLHGKTVQEAYQETMAFIDRVKAHGRSVSIVTGRSGRIRSEFREWLNGISEISRIEELNGGGAFRIQFKRRKAPNR